MCCLKKDVNLFDDWAAKNTLENNFHQGNHYEDGRLHSRSYDIQEMSLLGSLNVYCTCLLNATLWLSLRFVYNKKALKYINVHLPRLWSYRKRWTLIILCHLVSFNPFICNPCLPILMQICPRTLNLFEYRLMIWRHALLSIDNENYFPYCRLSHYSYNYSNDNFSNRNQHHHFDQLSGYWTMHRTKSVDDLLRLSKRRQLSWKVFKTPYSDVWNIRIEEK